MEPGLLERLRARDPHAQQELRAAHFPKVLALCSHLIQDRRRAEETAEDIWMDFVYDHVDRVQQERALMAYLRMMTVRRCVRIRDWQARHLEFTELQTDGDMVENTAVLSLDAQRSMTKLARCLEALTQRGRSILRLRYHQEMTQEAVGKALGVSKQYVGRVIGKSLLRLRACMERE